MTPEALKAIHRRLFNACDPSAPATSCFFVQTESARGGHNFKAEIHSRLNCTDAGKYLCTIFSGHIGCGKSSELLHLAEALRDPELPEDERFLVVVANTDEYLDTFDATPTDVLLAIFSEVGAALRGVGIDLKDSYLLKRLRDVKALALSDVALEEVGLHVATASLKAVLKRDPDNRREVRKRLEPQLTSLREELNRVLDEARLGLKRKGFRDIVIVLDGLDRISLASGGEEGARLQRDFFIDKSAQLTGLNAHMVYTVPLDLVLFEGPVLSARYGTTPVVLPMIKVEEKDHSANSDGYKILRELAQKRLGDVPLESVVDPEALDFLIRYSGGHARHFISFLRNAALAARDRRIDLAIAEEALGPTVETFARMPRGYWAKLAALEATPDRQIDPGDPDVRKMLQLNYILEYRNGGIAKARFDKRQTWYAVHPILRELSLFQDALAALKGP